MSLPVKIKTNLVNHRGSVKTLFLLFTLAILLVALWIIYQRFVVFPMPDFLEYWASGRINLTGGNPYAPDQMLNVEKTVGWSDNQPLMMLNPPWTLFYAMLFGVFDYTFSRYLCFIIQVFVVFFCSTLIWRSYHGDKHKEWIAWIVALSFGPILRAIQSGQVTILVFLGAVGFLYFSTSKVSRKMDFWAGVFASLVLIKPHLVSLFIIAILLWLFSQRRFHILLGMIAGITSTLATVWMVNPRILSQYIAMLRFYPLENWMTSTLGATLRLAINPDQFYFQFIPLFAGIIWFIFFWSRNKDRFDWNIHLPLVILVSSVISPYGWTLDFSIIAICIITVAVRFANNQWNIPKLFVFFSYWIANLLIIFLSVSQNWFWWFPGFLLIWYLLSTKFLLRSDRVSFKSGNVKPI